MSSKKRQQTMAKRSRELAVKEKRDLKAQKKQATRDAKAAGLTPGAIDETGDIDVEDGSEVVEVEEVTPA